MFNRLVGQLFLVTGNLHDAEDVVQEALIRAARRWPRIRGYEAPEAWVRRVALNLAANRARHARLRLRARPVEPADGLAVSEEAVVLAAALRRLPIVYRQVLVLHYVVDLQVEEIARTLGVPVGTVKTRLARGRKALGRRLEHEEIGQLHGQR